MLLKVMPYAPTPNPGLNLKHWVCIFFFFLAGAGFAQTVTLDSAELAEFMDGVMTTQLKNKQIVGATLSIVQHNRVLLSKGYGYADIKKKTPVDPRKTLFRIGSVSKLFVWTALMQLAGQGKVDLKADVNTYCKDFQVPDAFGKPVTVLDLMNHTPGFEDKVIGLFARGPEGLRPLGDLLREQMPERIWAPGMISSYSNHGAAMAAYIVEQVSGMAWDEYVEKHIIHPLRMGYSSFRQPLPDTLLANMSKGYRYNKGLPAEADFEFIPLAPAGSASSTAWDMARFMRAHLNWGRLGAVRILDSLDAVTMRQPSFRNAPGMNPMRHGFIDMSRYGQEIFGHGGDTEIFHSNLALFPTHGIGFFVSFNSIEGGGVSNTVLDAFIEHFFPQPKIPTLRPNIAQVKSLGNFAGAFRANRFCRSDLSRLTALPGQVQLAVEPDGTVVTHFQNKTRRWIQRGDLLFREEDGLDQMAFRTNEEGQVTHFFLSSLPILAFERVPLADTLTPNILLLSICGIILLTALVGWPLGVYFRNRYAVRTVRVNLLPAEARWVAWAAIAGLFTFLIGLAIQASYPMGLVYGLSDAMQRWLFLPWIILVLMLRVLWNLLRFWGLGSVRLGARITYTLIFLALTGVYLFMFNWNIFPG